MSNNSVSIGALTLHAEVLNIIMSSRQLEGTPKLILGRLCNSLLTKELSTVIKEELKDLLNQINRL
jgi:hypothetical protein